MKGTEEFYLLTKRCMSKRIMHNSEQRNIPRTLIYDVAVTLTKNNSSVPFVLIISNFASMCQLTITMI